MLSLLLCFVFVSSASLDLPEAFIAVNDDLILLIELNRASVLNATGQLIGLDCQEHNETSLFLGVGTPCIYDVKNGVPCSKTSHVLSACDFLSAWSSVTQQAAISSAHPSCFASNASRATVCFTDSSLSTILSFQVGDTVLKFTGWLPNAQAPLSGFVFPSFLCSCPSVSPSSSLSSSPALSKNDSTVFPAAFVARVVDVSSKEEKIMFVDLLRDRATFWNAANQPIGLNCSSFETSYVVELNSSCSTLVRNGASCPGLDSPVTPCTHVRLWNEFARLSTGLSPGDTRCMSADNRFATLCLTRTAKSSFVFLNYTFNDQVFDFVDMVDASGPDSVYPFVPAADCPCAKNKV